MEPIDTEVQPSRQHVQKPRKARRLKRKKKKDHHFGEANFTLKEAEVFGEASWLEVCHSCFIHSTQEWIHIFLSIILIFFCFYVFGLGLGFMGSGAQVMAGCGAGELFGDSSNPIAGLMTGILATVLLQSSSTTTSIVVGLVGEDTGVISVRQGIYMIMGANIGTTVTSTIVALGQFHDVNQLELAFGGATVHDLFNFLSVGVLFPLEILTGYLYHLTAALVRGADTEKGEKWEGPAKKLISPLAAKVLIANKKVINAVAAGKSCNDFYPIECIDPSNPTKKTCPKVGLIQCDKNTGICPAFFQPDATRYEDQISGLVVFSIGLFVIFLSMYLLVILLQKMLMGVSVRVIYKAVNLNGYLLILAGAGATMLLQSSSTTTSFITPIVGMGALGIEQMYPITIGANLGTTLTALLAALVTDGNDALQVALAHLMFNISGMMIWYPIPYVRDVPVKVGKRLGRAVKYWRGFAFVYILVMYFLLPAIGLGLVTLFSTNQTSLHILASILTALVGFIIIFLSRWCCFGKGQSVVFQNMAKKHRRYVLTRTLASDMDRLKRRVRRLIRDLPPSSRPPPKVNKGGHNNNDNRSNNGNSNTAANTNTDMSSSSSTTGIGTDAHTNSITKLRKQALENLPDDMDYINVCFATVFEHLGLDGDEYDDDDFSEHDVENNNNNNNNQETAPSSTANGQSSSTTTNNNDESFWVQVPPIYIVSSIIVFAGILWGLILLFLHGSKATVGAACFLTIIIGTFFMWLLHWFITKNGKKRCLIYFNDCKRRDEALASLPDDMKELKTGLRRVLHYYKL